MRLMKEYIPLCKRSKNLSWVEPLDAQGAARLNEIESQLSLEVLVEFRKRVSKEIYEEEKLHAKEKPKKRTMFQR
jgi:hypothetical protein